MDDDLDSWAEKNRLPEKVVQVLQEQGFTCADNVKDVLSPDDVKSCFQDSGLLNMAQCLALKKALSKPSVTPDFTASSARSLPPPSQSDALSSISAYNPSPQTVPLPRPSNPRESCIPQQSHASTTQYNLTAGGASGFGSPGAMNVDGITSAFRAVDIQEDLDSWAEKNRLPEKIVQVLQEQGFTCADDVKDVLSPDDVKSCFQDSRLLNMAQCLALKKAVSKSSVTPDFTASSARSLPLPGQSDALSSISAYNPSPQTVRLPLPSNPQQSHASTTQYNPTAGGASGFGSPGAMNVDGITSEFNAVDIPKEEVYRFQLLGKTGVGKSATGNTILGKDLFHVDLSLSSVTRDCEREVNCWNGCKFEIMDSPGLFDTHRSNEEIGALIIKCFAGMHPGPHAFLYVMCPNRFTAEDYRTYHCLKTMFDENITKYMIVLFTGGDQLKEQKKSIEVLLAQNTSTELQQVLDECNNRYVLFNNMAQDKWPQVERLLSVVKKMRAQNNDQPYTCSRYEYIGREIEKDVAQRLKESEKFLERKNYIQQLQRQIAKAEERIKEIDEQSKKNERERQRKLDELKHQGQDDRQAKKKMQDLMQEMKRQRCKEFEELQKAVEERKKLSVRMAKLERQKKIEYDQKMENAKTEVVKRKGSKLARLIFKGFNAGMGAAIGGAMGGPAGAAVGFSFGMGVSGTMLGE